jgi:hypothetical protein
MGFVELSQMMAGQAVTRFRAQKATHWEALAQAKLAFYLATRKKIPESEQAAQRASQLLEKLEFRPLRIAAATALARAAALNGRHAEAISSLDSLLQEAGQIGLVQSQLEIRLALGEIEIQSGEAAKGRARLGTLRGEATGRGFGLIARKAAAALAN